MQPEASVMRVLLVRHGETEDNKSRTIAGQRPGALTELGKMQASKIGIYLHQEKRVFDYIYVSDLGRTKDTFKNVIIKYPELKATPTSFTPLIREKAGGVLEGKSLASWEQEAKKQGKSIRDYKCQGGESWKDVMSRAEKFIDQIVQGHLLGGKAKKLTRLLVVTHGGFIMEFINCVEKMRGNEQKFNNTAKNCSMFQFQFRLAQDLNTLPGQQGASDSTKI